jgi:hypothetical protein
MTARKAKPQVHPFVLRSQALLTADGAGSYRSRLVKVDAFLSHEYPCYFAVCAFTLAISCAGGA